MPHFFKTGIVGKWVNIVPSFLKYDLQEYKLTYNYKR